MEKNKERMISVKKINIDTQQIENSVKGFLKSTLGTIIGSVCITGISAVCRKLDLPTAFNPYDFEPMKPRLMLVPTNAVEASMVAIYESLSRGDWDSTKENSARQIYSILKESYDKDSQIQDSTKTFAISLLRDISSMASWNSTKERINDYIVKIGKGDI